MSKKKQQGLNQDDDGSIFQEAMKGVRRLDAGDRVVHPVSKKRPAPPRIDNIESQIPLTDPGIDVQLGTEEAMFFHRGGIQQTQLRKLKRGQVDVGDVLDLHGFKREQAAQMLFSFINSARHNGIRWVRVIHGKGYRSGEKTGVLKIAVYHWLQQLDSVLAFASAPPSQGGTGAVNVLLKRMSE